MTVNPSSVHEAALAVAGVRFNDVSVGGKMTEILTGVWHFLAILAGIGAFVGVGVLMSWSHSGEGWN